MVPDRKTITGRFEIPSEIYRFKTKSYGIHPAKPDSMVLQNLLELKTNDLAVWLNILILWYLK